MRKEAQKPNQWLKDEVKRQGKTLVQLARHVGQPPPRMTDIIDGKRRPFAGEAQLIAEFIGWPTDVVIKRLGGGSARPADMPNDAEETGFRVERVQVAGEVEAGVFKETLEYVPDDGIYSVEVVSSDIYARLPKVALRIKGPSMNILYPEGSYVIVVPTIHLGEGWEPKSGNKVVVQRVNEFGLTESTVKEYVVDASGEVLLYPRSTHHAFQQPWRLADFWSENGDFDEHTDQLRITGLVIKSIRDEA